VRQSTKCYWLIFPVHGKRRCIKWENNIKTNLKKTGRKGGLDSAGWTWGFVAGYCECDKRIIMLLDRRGMFTSWSLVRYVWSNVWWR